MKKETVRVGLKRSKNYQGYESVIEREIFYKNSTDRDKIIKEMYAQCRKDLTDQMAIDGVK